jgi:23S rRNA pseudouridine2605 synthase
MRLNKFLAQSGLGSRRAVEQLILDGLITVNGQVIRELATQVNPETDRVSAHGQSVKPVQKLEYLILNKPRGYDVTRGGEHHHRRAWDLLPKGSHPSIQSVGRLDRNSTGLLIFTNDGEFAFRLTHPRYGCRKTYEVDVEGNVPAETVQRLKEGIMLEDGPAHAVRVERLAPAEEGQSRLRLVMEEGRNRIVRRMCETLGFVVINLNRTAIGPLEMGNLPRGKTRPLTRMEINRLRQSIGLAAMASATEPSPMKKPPQRQRTRRN